MPRKPGWIGWAVLILPAILLVAFVATSNKPPLHTDPPALAIQVAGPDGLSRTGNPDGRLTASTRKRFPLGTPVAAMLQALEAEGFAPVPEALRCKPAVPSTVGHRVMCWTPPHPERQLLYIWGREDCSETVAVHWDEDASARLTALSAEYHAVCT